MAIAAQDGRPRGERRPGGRARVVFPEAARRGADRQRRAQPRPARAALKAQREQSGRCRLGEVIIDLGLADEVQIARALSDQLRLPFVDLTSMPLAEAAVRALPRHVAQRLQVVPVEVAG